jgi:hypothetical protein
MLQDIMMTMDARKKHRAAPRPRIWVVGNGGGGGGGGGVLVRRGDWGGLARETAVSLGVGVAVEEWFLRLLEGIFLPTWHTMNLFDGQHTAF